MQRKERNRSLSKLGNLAARAGIDHLPATALYICFRRIADDAHNPQSVAAWEREGLDLLRTPKAPRAVMVDRFSRRLERDAAESLRRLGFRRNRVSPNGKDACRSPPIR